MKCSVCKDRLATHGDKCWTCRDEAIRRVTFPPQMERTGGQLYGKVGQYQTSLHNPHAGATRGG